MNLLGFYAFKMKAGVVMRNFDKIHDENKQKIPDNCSEISNALDKNHTSEKGEFEHQQKELVSVIPSLPSGNRVQEAS